MGRYLDKEHIDKMFKVWDGYEQVRDVTHPLEFLAVHFPMNKLGAALDWLLSNKLTGRRFVEFFKYDCGASLLHFHKILLMKIEKERKVRAVLAGKDFAL